MASCGSFFEHWLMVSPVDGVVSLQYLTVHQDGERTVIDNIKTFLTLFARLLSSKYLSMLEE